MNTTPPTDHQQETFNRFIEGAVEVRPNYGLQFAKRIASVNSPTADMAEFYCHDRVHEIAFDDGTTMDVHEDHWRQPGVQLAAGNWVVMRHPGSIEGYYSQEQFDDVFYKVFRRCEFYDRGERCDEDGGYLVQKYGGTDDECLCICMGHNAVVRSKKWHIRGVLILDGKTTGDFEEAQQP